MSPPCTRSPAAGLRFVTAARGLTGRKRTARPSALSARCSAVGLTELSTAQAKNARPPLTAGFGTTTIDVDTQPSAANPRSAEPTCSGLTPRQALLVAPVRLALGAAGLLAAATI